MLKWDITYKCNLYCKHCLNSKLLDNKVEELNTSEIKNIIDDISGEVPIDYIHILGGEPTFRKDFIEITNYMGDKDIRFGFNTNGLNIKIEKFRDVYLNKSLKNIVISLEGPNAMINDKIRGKNVFDIVIKNVKSLVKFKKENNLDHFYITINTVISKTNYDYVLDMVDFCIELGVDDLNLLALLPMGNADNNMAITDEQELKLVKNLSIKYNQVKDKLKIVPKFARPIIIDYCREILGVDFPEITHGCGAGTTFAFLNNLGQLSPCDRFFYTYVKEDEKDKFSIKDKKFFEVWNDNVFNIPYQLTEGSSFYTKYKPCNECKYLGNKCYPCFIPHQKDEEVKVSQCIKYFEMLKKVEVS
ncbi:radical SAM protein [Clostridiaceae bacterium M8S5]|nr:radical SAM protein [Clostridiaceae bacterium M8S5]